MRKLLLLITALLTLGVSGAWADSKISKAVAGTYLFDSSNPALTVNEGGTATITNSEGVIVIHHDNLSTVGKGANNYDRTYAAVVLRVVDMPTTAPESFSKFISLKPSTDFTGSIGLGVTIDGKLKGTWGGSEWNGGNGGVVTSSAVTGEHTIVMLCNDGGTTIYLDNASTSVNNSGLKSSSKWTDLRIESAYASYVKSVYVFSGDQASNISAFFSELSNVVTVANEETKNVSDNSTATRFFVASGGTLTADAAYDIDKIEGAGDVTMTADQSITGNAGTVATGKLTINEGKTLTLGTGQGQANSIESFTSIELAGTIKHNNSVATLNNVTVPENKTGKIFAYDMGSTSDGFKLAGTTTLNGDLTVCNKYNFQMKVDNLAGSGTLLICGTTGDAFNAEGTASNEKAIINVAAATTFTGTINLNNVPTDSHPGTNTSQVTVQGNLVGCTLKKTTGDYFYYSGASLNGTTLDGVILSGTSRINTRNTVNIKNLAGNNLDNTSNLYAFVGSGTINFYGTNDLTKKSDGTVCNSANIGYGASDAVIIKAGANVTAGIVQSSATLSSNAPITVEETATLTCVGSTGVNNNTVLIYSTNLTNDGTINLNADGRTSQVSALSGSGTLNVASGSSIEAPSTISSTMTLTGAGDVVLTSFPSTTAPTLSAWTGAVEFPNGGGNGTNLEAIFNAWGNTNSTIKLNNVTGGYLGKNGTVNPTLNILSGKTLILNNGYSNSNSTLTKVTGAGTLDRQGWSSSTNHNLYITTLTGFTGTLSGTGHPIIVQKLVLATEPAGDALLVKTSESNVTLNDVYVGSIDITGVCSKKVKTVDDVTGYYVTNKQDAIDAIAPYISYIGSELGKYTVNLGSTPYTNVSDLETTISGWATLSDCVTPKITINQPTTCKFYRFSIGTNYMCNVENNEHVRTVTTTNDDKSTIFYLDANNYLVDYAEGFGFNFGYCRAVNPGTFNEFEFTESSTKGKYFIHSLRSTDGNVWSNRYITINGSVLAEGQGVWTIEAVDELPITFKGQFASFFSPVDLTLAAGVKAYTGTLTNNNTILKLTEVDYVPANTGVILEYEAFSSEPTVNFTIRNAVTPIEGTSLTGATAAQSVVADSKLVLGKNGENWGIYKYGGTTLGGFKAYMDMPATPATPVKGFTFTFGDADAIANVLNGEEKVNEVYDLSGRRVNVPARGLYIVNGKKVVIK